jgi:hypothetical protein
VNNYITYSNGRHNMTSIVCRPVRTLKVRSQKSIKSAVFWDVMPCRSCVNRRFGGTYRLHFQGRNIRERGTRVSRWLQTELSLHPPANAGSSLADIFYPEDGGDTFLRNVGSHKIYTTPHPRRRHSS